MKPLIFLAVFGLFFHLQSYGQTEFGLKDLINFSKLKSSKDFENFKTVNHYQLSLVKLSSAGDNSKLFDIEGNPVMKQFDSLQIGDTLIFTQQVSVGNTVYTNTVAYFAITVGNKLEFVTNSAIAGRFYLQQLKEEAKDLNFKEIKKDTLINGAERRINYKTKNDDYLLECTSKEFGDTDYNGKFFSKARATISYKIIVTKLRL